MTNFEEKLIAMKNHLDSMQAKINKLTYLNEKIRQYDCFTVEEMNTVHIMLEKLKREKLQKQEIYDSQQSIYNEQIKKIKDTLTLRQSILDNVFKDCTFDTNDICEIFVEKQSSLQTQLKKSEDKLEQK